MKLKNLLVLVTTALLSYTFGYWFHPNHNNFNTQVETTNNNVYRAKTDLLSDDAWGKKVLILEVELRARGWNIRKAIWTANENYYQFLQKIKDLPVIDTAEVKIVVDEKLGVTYPAYRIGKGEIYIDYRVSVEEFVKFLKS